MYDGNDGFFFWRLGWAACCIVQLISIFLMRYLLSLKWLIYKNTCDVISLTSKVRKLTTFIYVYVCYMSVYFKCINSRKLFQMTEIISVNNFKGSYSTNLWVRNWIWFSLYYMVSPLMPFIDCTCNISIKVQQRYIEQYRKWHYLNNAGELTIFLYWERWKKSYETTEKKLFIVQNIKCIVSISS